MFKHIGTYFDHCGCGSCDADECNVLVGEDSQGRKCFVVADWRQDEDCSLSDLNPDDLSYALEEESFFTGSGAHSSSPEELEVLKGMVLAHLEA